MAINYIRSVKPQNATNKVKEVFGELKNDMGDVVEPISMHAINPDLLSGIWNILREVVVVDGELSRLEKEAIGAAVSQSNRCGYCVDAHTIMLIGLKSDVVAKAIEHEDPLIIPQQRLRDIVSWALYTKEFDSVEMQAPPFRDDEIPEAIGTAVFFHYLNRMVTAFLGPTILPINLDFLKGFMKKMAGKKFASVLAKDKSAKKLDYRVYAEYNEKLDWALLNDQVHYVFFGYYELLENLSNPIVPDEVRCFIYDQMSEWNGIDLEQVNQLHESLKFVSAENRVLAEVLYLQAFSPDRITPDHMKKLGAFYNQSAEAMLVAMAWVSLESALFIGSKIGAKYCFPQLSHK